MRSLAGRFVGAFADALHALADQAAVDDTETAPARRGTTRVDAPTSPDEVESDGDDGLERLVNDIPPQPMTREVATEFLAALPRAAVKVVGESLAKLAVSRKDKIMGVLQSLAAGNQLEG